VIILLIILVVVYLWSPSSLGTIIASLPTFIPGITLATPNITLETPAVVTSTRAIPPAGGLGQRTKTSGCQSSGNLPDPACTPGHIFAATKEQICTPGYARSVRDVSQSLKEKVYESYGITSRTPGQYNIDHLISLQLGGSNDIANLWPLAAEPRPGYREKIKVENYLHDRLCSGAMTLQDVQVQIATDWISVYNRMPKLAAPMTFLRTP
jgi:hypothetical protein